MMFKRVKAGLHRAEIAEGTYELERDPDDRRARRWTLYYVADDKRESIDGYIHTVADGEVALALLLHVESHLHCLNATRSNYYRWLLNTRLGDLHISPYGDRIMMRFENVELAKTELAPTPGSFNGFNPYSGKWNMHWAHNVPMEIRLKEFIERMDLVKQAG